MKKVTHILYSGLGGHGSVFRSFINADKENEFESSALFYGIEEVKKEYLEFCHQKGIKFQYIRKKRGIDLAFFFRVYFALKKLNSNHVFIHGSYLILPVFFYFLFKKKSIIVRETQANHLKTKFEWIMLLIAQQLSSKMVYLSQTYFNEVNQKLKLFFAKSKSLVIPNGIDLETFSPKVSNQKPKVLKVGMLSRLVKIKDHTTLLGAIALLNKSGIKVELFIAGDGEIKTQLIDLKEKLNLTNVHFLGMINEAEIPSFLRSLDIYVHASFGETMSTSIMQAQACGLPIIASDVPGINNVITNKENGILVAIQDEKALGNSIHQLIINDKERLKLSKASIEFAKENLSNFVMFKKYKELFL